MAKKRAVKRRRKVAAKSVGLTAAETLQGGAAADTLARQIEADGGAVLARYREPFGGTPVVLAALPIDRVEPTPFQRDPSLPHVKRLMTVLETLGRFLDPVIAIHQDDGYWTPNGNHRLQAMRKLGARAIVALVIPDADVAFKILALNTEKAHNLKEKSLETIRMLRALADARTGRNEREYGFEFDQPSFLTLGAAYEQRPRLSGGAYQSLLRRIDDFQDERLPAALRERERRAGRILEIDDQVGKIVDRLKKKGLTSPYLRPFVVARIN
ncbi:MAG TPA: ParB N-terminal domain-containing protein, partial [Vicinamibacterales bacterium]|nr:ParB N-terminal domain-containing protein [Vicinamibacterales bacterium]